MEQEVFVQIDSLAFAPKDYLEKMAEVDIGLVAPNSLHDYESYFYVLLHFIEGSCSWDAFELQDMSVFAKARKILEERTDYQVIKIHFFLSIMLPFPLNFHDLFFTKKIVYEIVYNR